MKIKKYILLGSLAIMSTGITSCGSDWLDITNNTQDTVEDYYTTDDNIWQSVVAAYDPLHWFDYANNYTGLNIYPEVLSVAVPTAAIPPDGGMADRVRKRQRVCMRISLLSVITEASHPALTLSIPERQAQST